MQADFHRDMVLLLGVRAGLEYGRAALIAWSSVFLDKNKKATLHGLRTQCNIFEDPRDRTVQRDILVMHFIPGGGDWVVTPNNSRARALCEAALKSGDEIAMGIAIHTLDDSWSHQNFTAWEEPFNNCFAWDKIWRGVVPDIGHADVGVRPDVMNISWWDPRTNTMINNPKRFLQAARKTYMWLVRFAGKEFDEGRWFTLAEELKPIIRTAKYDERKVRFHLAAGGKWPGDEFFRTRYKNRFLRAAAKHQALCLTLCADLPAKDPWSPEKGAKDGGKNDNRV